MSKWKCEICNSEFENFHAQGFNHKIYCPLCYFKKLYNDTELEREKLQIQLQQKENIIKEVREYIDFMYKQFEKIEDKEFITNRVIDISVLENILEILDKENRL